MEHEMMDTLQFFEVMPGALPLYEQLLELVRQTVGPFSIRVQKTQITWSNRYVFACISFAKVRPAKLRPQTYLVVTFGLDHRVP